MRQKRADIVRVYQTFQVPPADRESLRWMLFVLQSQRLDLGRLMKEKQLLLEPCPLAEMASLSEP